MQIAQIGTSVSFGSQLLRNPVIIGSAISRVKSISSVSITRVSTDFTPIFQPQMSSISNRHLTNRPMSPQEKSNFKGWFPNLDVNAAVVTGEATGAYNCIAWTVGIVNRWIWPGNSIRDFDAFYKQHGFNRSNSGPVAVWATSVMTHGCVSGPNHGPRWESKCGSSLRIQHALKELEGSNYGRVTAFYKRAGLSTTDETLKKAEMIEVSTSEKAFLEKETSKVSGELKETFEKKFEAWKKTWFANSLLIDSNPYSRAHGKEFDDLIALGSQIIPLVIEKLTHKDNFFALVLYDAIQSNASLIVQHGSEDPRISDGEQGRAVLTVKAWLAR